MNQEVKNLARKFTVHFEQLKHIDPQHTNHELIASLSSQWIAKREMQMQFCKRGSGVTTTITEWVKWIDANIFVVSRTPDLWKQRGIASGSWRTPIPAGNWSLVIIDSPTSFAVWRSVIGSVKFQSWLKQIEAPVFYAIQLDNQNTVEPNETVYESASKFKEEICERSLKIAYALKIDKIAGWLSRKLRKN